MPKLFHAPHTRSSRIISQLLMAGRLDAVDIVLADVLKDDGTGRRDPVNPHPEGKVPFLVTDNGEEMRESTAIMMYLDELFGHPLSPAPGQPKRAEFLSWMAYYSGVLEPVLVGQYAGIDTPAWTRTFRTMAEVAAQLDRGLQQGLYLLGETLSLADLIMASPFQWVPGLVPDSPAIRAWLDRVAAAQDGQGLEEFEARALDYLSTRRQA